MSTEHRLHPDIPSAEATSVTHFICPEGPTADGEPVATHHLVPVRAGYTSGQAAYEQTCSYCGKTEAVLRSVLPLSTTRTAGRGR